MEKSSFFNVYTKFLIFQFAFMVVIFLLASLLRYFNTPLFNDVHKIYDEYVNTEISLSLVMDE